MPIMCVPLPFLSPAQENKASTICKLPKDAFISQSSDCLQCSPLALSHHFYCLARFLLHVILTSPPEEMSNTQTGH